MRDIRARANRHNTGFGNLDEKDPRRGERHHHHHHRTPRLQIPTRVCQSARGALAAAEAGTVRVARGWVPYHGSPGKAARRDPLLLLGCATTTTTTSAAAVPTRCAHAHADTRVDTLSVPQIYPRTDVGGC